VGIVQEFEDLGLSLVRLGLVQISMCPGEEEKKNSCRRQHHCQDPKKKEL